MQQKIWGLTLIDCGSSSFLELLGIHYTASKGGGGVTNLECDLRKREMREETCTFIQDSDSEINIKRYFTKLPVSLTTWRENCLLKGVGSNSMSKLQHADSIIDRPRCGNLPLRDSMKYT